jgi:hypothetical protein
VKLGRPVEKSTNRNKQDSPFGKDRLGNLGMHDKDNENENGSIKANYKNGSPLALEAKQVYLKNKTLIEGLVKQVAVEKSSGGESLLDESKLKE